MQQPQQIIYGFSTLIFHFRARRLFGLGAHFQSAVAVAHAIDVGIERDIGHHYCWGDRGDRGLMKMEPRE